MEKVKIHYWEDYGSFKAFERHLIGEGYTKVYISSLIRAGFRFDYLDEYQMDLGKLHGNSNLCHLSNKKITLIRISGYDTYYYGAYFLIKVVP